MHQRTIKQVWLMAKTEFSLIQGFLNAMEEEIKNGDEMNKQQITYLIGKTTSSFSHLAELMEAFKQE